MQPAPCSSLAGDVSKVCRTDGHRWSAQRVQHDLCQPEWHCYWQLDSVVQELSKDFPRQAGLLHVQDTRVTHKIAGSLMQP